MTTTEAQKKARDKWLKEKVADIRFRVPINEKELIQAHAKAQGESTNAFIYRAVKEAMERDGEKTEKES